MDAEDDGLEPGMAALVAWIEGETGLCFPEVHHQTIRRAAALRCAELGMPPADFEALLLRDSVEKCRFLAEIMIGETYFFRDERHFSILVSHVLPQLLSESRPLRFWSATCASGEEAISLVAVTEHVRETLGLEPDYRVLASDINRKALARLEAGSYPASSFRNDGKAWHGLLERCGTMQGEAWQASPASLSRIELRHLNIMTGELPEPGSLDLVFFRNTLVYMKQEQKARVMERIVGTMREGGYLFLASPEVPTVRHPLLEVTERNGGFFFRKRASALPAADAAAAARILPRLRPVRETAAPEDRPEARRTTIPRTTVRPDRPSRASSAQLRAALALASSRARGNAGEPTGDERVVALAAAFEEALSALQANRFSLAEELLDRLERDAGESQASQYLRGMALKHRGRSPEALELWEKARLYDPGFWPALFQAGMASMQGNPERGRALLGECLAAMDSDRDGAWFALLEGFDAPYYRRMAVNLIARAGGAS